MSDSILQGKIDVLKSEIASLTEKIRLKQTSLTDCSFREKAKELVASNSLVNNKVVLRSQRTLRGHYKKVNAAKWMPDSIHVVSCGVDGQVLVWNAQSAMKTHTIRSTDEWLTTCEGNANGLIVVGGMDTVGKIYRILPGTFTTETPIKRLRYHQGFLQDCKWVGGEGELILASGDGSCSYWDVMREQPLQVFLAHKEEVMGIDVVDKHAFYLGLL